MLTLFLAAALGAGFCEDGTCSVDAAPAVQAPRERVRLVASFRSGERRGLFARLRHRRESRKHVRVAPAARLVEPNHVAPAPPGV